MEIEEPINAFETNLITHLPSSTVKNRIKKFFGLPKSIHGAYTDHERCSWRMLNHQNKSNKFLFFF